MKFIAMLTIILSLSACNGTLSPEKRNIKAQFTHLAKITKESLPLAISEDIAFKDIEAIEDGLTLKFTYEVAEYDIDISKLDNTELGTKFKAEICNYPTFVPLFKDGANVVILFETIEKERIYKLRLNEYTCQ